MTKFTPEHTLAKHARPAAYRPRMAGESLRGFLMAMATLESLVSERDVQYASQVTAETLGEAYQHYFETQTQKARNLFLKDVEQRIEHLRHQASRMVATATRFANASEDGFGAAREEGVTVAVYVEGTGQEAMFRYKISRVAAAPAQRWSRELAEISTVKMLAEVTL